MSENEVQRASLASQCAFAIECGDLDGARACYGEMMRLKREAEAAQ